MSSPNYHFAESAIGGRRLIVEAGAERLVLDLGLTEASKWAEILRQPPPTLAHKLGVDAERPALRVGVVDDPALAAALDNATVTTTAEDTVLLAVLRVSADLDGALRWHDPNRRSRSGASTPRAKRRA